MKLVTSDRFYTQYGSISTTDVDSEMLLLFLTISIQYLGKTFF